jgi:short-subunit dehydrogenase
MSYNLLVQCDVLHSTLAHMVHLYGPFHFYAATKHAVSALTEGLRQELREANTRIRVTVRNPKDLPTRQLDGSSARIIQVSCTNFDQNKF